MAAPGFWDKPEAAKETVQKLKSLKAVIEPVRNAFGSAGDLEAMIALLSESEDLDVRAELNTELEKFAGAVNRIELLTFLSGPNDDRNCYFNIQAGTGISGHSNSMHTPAY